MVYLLKLDTKVGDGEEAEVFILVLRQYSLIQVLHLELDTDWV